MVFIPLHHGSGTVYGTVPPLRQTARHIPGGLAGPHLLPGAMAFQIRLVHQVNAVPVAEFIPKRLIGIMAGADRIDIVPL